MKGCGLDKSGVHRYNIPREVIDELHVYLFEKVENGGVLYLDPNTPGVVSRKYKVTKGHNDSVDVEEAMINLHTHPVHCYVAENTIWGWNSGEDIRECVLFSLKGCIAHAVIAVEGTYIFQVNPCVVSDLIHLDRCIDTNTREVENFRKKNDLTKKELIDLIRGVIIYLVEVYFRATHAFRVKSVVGISPEDYIKYTNRFDIKNIFAKNDVQGCGNFHCNGVPVYDGRRRRSMTKSIRQYSSEYEGKTNIMMVDAHGKTRMTKYRYSDVGVLLDCVKNMVLGDCREPLGDGKSWFCLKLFKNRVRLPSGRSVLYYDLSNQEKIECLEYYNGLKKTDDVSGIFQIAETPYFEYYKIEGECSHHDIKDKLSSVPVRRKSNIKSLVVYGSDKCGYTSRLVKSLKKKKIKVKYVKFPSIREAITKLQQKDETIRTIPQVYTLSGERIGGTEEVMRLL